MEPLTDQSIAIVTYLRSDRTPPLQAQGTGFFVRASDSTPVCISSAHLLGDEPIKKLPDTGTLRINGHSTTLLKDARLEHGVDVMVMAVPEILRNDPKTYCHKLGVSKRTNRVYYTHAWARLGSGVDHWIFVKVWGPRMESLSSTLSTIDPRFFTAWSLRNDVFSFQTGRAFSATNFDRGWSGAPVFNVREQLDDHRVIGVLNVAKNQPDSEDRRAIAVSVESLDFLGTAEPQQHEGRVIRSKDSWLRRCVSWLSAKNTPRYEISFQDSDAERSLLRIRYREIMKEDPIPPVPEPLSVYDHSI